MINQSSPYYCTLYRPQIGNFLGFKIQMAEAHHYLVDASQSHTLISRQIAVRLHASQQELDTGRMVIEIMLNADPISFEAKIDRGETPAIPQWSSVKVLIGSEIKMRVFDLIIGSDAQFKKQADSKLWQKYITDYKKNKKMSGDIS